jgi:hypothetical protein
MDYENILSALPVGRVGEGRIIGRYLLVSRCSLDKVVFMGLRPIIKKGLLATVGYLLSPFSWWNDLYINFPIAYVMAWIVSLLDKRLFAVALVVCYWITNIAGLVLLHKGLASAGNGDKSSRKQMLTNLIISVVYTGVIILLLHFGFLKLPQEYFGRPGR